MSIEPVKAYLLGILPDSEAAQLEAKYFADAAFLKVLERKEEDLISEYLHGQLPSSERKLFEERYHAVPLLKQKLDLAERRHQAGRIGSHRFMWQAVAGAVACSLALISLWLYGGRPSAGPRMQGQQQAAPSEPLLLSLNLSPGVQRGATTPTPVALPAGAALALVLELPGVRSSMEYTVRILRVGSGDSPLAVWTSPIVLRPRTSPTGQTLEIRFEASLALPDDYIVELLSADAAIAERYLFRITRKNQGL